MTQVARSVGKLTGKTLTGLKKVSKKTTDMAKEAPKKTSETVTKIKNDLVQGFVQETNTKIGVVEDEIIDTTSSNPQ
jgi:hypothetical protein